MTGRKVAAVAAVVVLAVFFSTGLILGVEAAEKEEKTVPIVVAHRAGAGFAPENTIAALEQTIRDGSVMAEIDVQQLKDGTLIVMHDSSFLRTAGVDKNVWETDYDEIRDYEVGTSFSGIYEGEGIPTLEQMLQCADRRILLMIELKYTGHEEGLESSVVELLGQYHMERSCIIGSMNMAILEKVKELDGGIPTVFIAHSLTEEQYDLAFADSYSIEAVSLSKELVERLHEQDKPVYGWTANTCQAMQLVLDSGADGIVTDNVYLTGIYLRNTRRMNAFNNSIKTICHW